MSLEKNGDKNSYTSVDVAKFVFCIFIIGLHTEVFSFLPEVVADYLNKLLLFIAVPYFFVASGFFLRKKYMTVNKNQYSGVLKAYIKRLLYPFAVFSGIWLIQQWTTQMLIGKMSKWEILIYLLKRLLFNPFGALWFVQALIVAAIIIYPMMKYKHGINICLVLGFILYVFALFCNSYYFVVENTRFEVVVDYYMVWFLTARNGVFIGILFVSVGMKCYDIFEKLRKSSGGGTIVLIIFILSMALYTVEITVLRVQGKRYIDYGEWYISLLFIAPTLFLLTVLYNLNVSSRISIVLRNLSTGMYYLHRPIQWWLAFYITNNVIVFVAVTVIAFTICMISYKVKFNNKYYLLR